MWIVNNDTRTHNIRIFDPPVLDFDSGAQEPGETVEIAFPDAGSFLVFCGIHPKMELYVDVDPLDLRRFRSRRLPVSPLRRESAKDISRRERGPPVTNALELAANGPDCGKPAIPWSPPHGGNIHEAS